MFSDLFFVGLLVLVLAVALLLETIPNFPLKVVDFVLPLGAALLETREFKQLLSFVLFCLEGLPHSVGHWGLVECLVSLNCHFYFISHSDKQKASLCTVNCDLSNQFIKGLRVELLSDGANTSFTGLTFLQLFIELFLQNDNVKARGRDGRNVLHPQLTRIWVLARRQNGVQIVFCFVSARLIAWTERAGTGFRTGVITGLGIAAKTLADEDGRVVLNEGEARRLERHSNKWFLSILVVVSNCDSCCLLMYSFLFQKWRTTVRSTLLFLRL